MVLFHLLQMLQRCILFHTIKNMNNSTFGNSNGWPHPKQLMSAKDLAIIAARIINEFPEYYPYFAEREFTYDDITQPNRNPLLKLGLGADGLKTGHTKESGYGLVGSAQRNGQRYEDPCCLGEGPGRGLYILY